jgi:DNA-binding NarL/FixJ family response regulator
LWRIKLQNLNSWKIRIIVAEDHQLIRKSLVDLIDSDRECRVVAEVNNGDDLVTEYFRVNPDLIVVNMILPHMNGIEAIEEIKRRDRRVKALFMSSHWDDVLIYQGYRCGGKGYFYRGDNSRKVINSIREIHSGEICFPDNMDVILAKYSNNNEYTGYENKHLQYLLSKREFEIFLLFGKAMTAREISHKLLISMKTVEYHLYNLKEKLNLKNRNQLISISTKHNLHYGERFKL